MLGLTQPQWSGAGNHMAHKIGAASDPSPERPERVVQGGDMLAPLIRTIEAEVIPRLLLVHHKPNGLETAVVHGEQLDESHVAHFCKLVLTQDAADALRYAEALIGQGFRVEMLYLDLLAPTARKLGDMWNDDTVDFVEVTVAVGRMQHVIRALSDSAYKAPVQRSQLARILLAPAPGSQHSLGLLILKEFFTRAGWDANGGPALGSNEVLDAVAGEWFDTVGISVGSDVNLPGLTNWIATIRETSKNPAIVILVGGQAFSEHPEYAAIVGANATGKDAMEAVALAERLLDTPQAAR